jgi:hypothetical protein
MAIRGLGVDNLPFFYFDEFVSEIDWNRLHNEVSFGISQSHWHKKFVSSGVHTDWKDREITTVFNEISDRLSFDQIELYKKLKTTDERIKFLTALTYIPHPFWLIFLRWNKRVESTGVYNKAVPEDCHWTDDVVHFPYLKKIIEDMPFDGIGRVLLFMTEANNSTVPHFDVLTQKQRQEKLNDDFIWFSTKGNSKSVFVLDDETMVKHYPDPNKKFVWFNEMDYHGTDAVSHFSFSIRIDGRFNSKIKEKIYGNNRSSSN